MTPPSNSSGRSRVIKYHAHGFTAISNDVLNDWTLSCRALALLVRIQGLPDDWTFSAAGMTKTFSTDRPGMDGRDSMRKAIAELEEKGYLIRAQERVDGGVFGAGVYAVVDDRSIYFAVRAELETMGMTVLSPVSMCVECEQHTSFVGPGTQPADPVEDVSEQAECDEPQNPRSQPVAAMPPTVLTCGNASDDAPEGQNAKPQVTTGGGFTDVGCTDVGKSATKQHIEETTIHPSIHPEAEEEPGTEGVNAPPDGRMDGRAREQSGPPVSSPPSEPKPSETEEPAEAISIPDARKLFDAMAAEAVNRNLLSSDSGRARAIAAIRRLAAEGFDADAILAAWRAHQAGLKELGRERRYYTQLVRWLEAIAARELEASLAEEEPVAERMARSVRFSLMAATDEKLGELVCAAKDAEELLGFGETDNATVEAAWEAARAYFDEHDEGKANGNGRKAGKVG